MKRQTVSITKQRAAYARNNGIYVICGKKISPNEKEDLFAIYQGQELD